MPRNPNESRLASAFATLVCAWAVSLVVLGLGSATRPQADGPPAPVVAAAVGR